MSPMISLRKLGFSLIYLLVASDVGWSTPVLSTISEPPPTSDLQLELPTTSNLGSFNIVINPSPALAANNAALMAFQRAADQWEAFIADPITVTVNADFSILGPSILGSASSVILVSGFDNVRNAMAADAADEVDDAVTGFLPTAAQFTAFVPSGFTLKNQIAGTKANLKALGFTGLDATFGVADADIAFNSTFSSLFDFDNSNGVTATQYDFEMIAAHEIGHALGFISTVDVIANIVPQAVAVTTLDLFRFDDLAANNPETFAEFTLKPRSLVPGNIEHFDQIMPQYGDEESLFSNGVSAQASHWRDSLGLGLMDPTLGLGEVTTISLNDLRTFDLIGYEIVAVPEAGSLLFGGVAMCLGGVCSWAKRRRPVSPASV